MSKAPASPVAGGGSRNRTGLGVILLTIFLDLVGFSIIFPLYPAMLTYYLEKDGDAGLLGSLVSVLQRAAASSGADAEFYTIVLFGGVLGSLYSVLQFVAAPLWGSLSDRLGRRNVLVVTVAGTALSYLLWFFSGSFALLLVSRLLGGLMAGNLSVATAAIADVTEAKDRAKGMGLVGAAFGMGFIFGPAIGGGLSGVDLSGVVPLPGVNPFSMAALGAFVLAAINLVWVVLRFAETLDDERLGKAKSGRPINPLKLFSPLPYAGVTRTNLVYFLFILGFSGMEFTLVFLARDRFAYTPMQNTGLFLFTGVLIALVQGGVVRRLAPKLGEKKLTLLGFLLLEPGLVLVGLAGSEAMLYGGLALLAIGSAFATPALSALVSLYAPDERQGEALGVFRSLGSLARAVGPLAAAVLYWKLGSRAPYVGGAALMSLPLLLALGLPPIPSRGEAG